jgi:hypothetical protein
LLARSVTSANGPFALITRVALKQDGYLMGTGDGDGKIPSKTSANARFQVVTLVLVS